MNGDDFACAAMPDWGWQLGRQTRRYEFSGYWLRDRLAVHAKRRVRGRGPLEVITTDEAEMRAAIGLNRRQASPARQDCPG